MLASRYIGFVKSLCSSPKYCMRVLASTSMNDMRTVMGRTVHMISVECSSSKDSLTSATVKKSMKYFNVPDTEQWRVGVLSELLSETLEIPGFASQEIEDIKSYICTSLLQLVEGPFLLITHTIDQLSHTPWSSDHTHHGSVITHTTDQ